MWQCPECKETMQDHDDNCWNCRTRNPNIPEKPAQEPVRPAEAARPSAPAMKKCPFCAEEIHAEAVKCRYCGSAMPQPGARDEWGTLRAVVITVLILILAVTVVLGFVVLSKPLSRLVSGAGRGEGVPGTASTKPVAYEEIYEYDGKGNVKKSVKTYPQEGDKGK